MMDSHQLGLPAYEYAYLHSDSLTTGSPAFQEAARGVAARCMRRSADRRTSQSRATSARTS